MMLQAEPAAGVRGDPGAQARGQRPPRAAQQEGGPQRLSDEAEAIQVSVGHGRGGLMVGEGGACEGLAGRWEGCRGQEGSGFGGGEME